MRTNRIIVFIILSLGYFMLMAADHSGLIYTETWTSAGNPHIITGDVTVSNGVL